MPKNRIADTKNNKKYLYLILYINNPIANTEAYININCTESIHIFVVTKGKFSIIFSPPYISFVVVTSSQLTMLPIIGIELVMSSATSRYMMIPDSGTPTKFDSKK